MKLRKMDADDWVIDIAEEKDKNDELDSTSEFAPLPIEGMREDENILNNTDDFTTAASVYIKGEMLPNANDFAKSILHRMETSDVRDLSSSVLHGGEILPSANDFTGTANIYHPEGDQSLPPLIVHKRPWPGTLSTSHNCHTIQRIRRKSFDVPDIVISGESKDDGNVMLQKTLAKPRNQRNHLSVSLPSISEKGWLTPPTFDSSSRSTYQLGLRRRSTTCVRLPKLSLNEMERKKDDGL